VIGDVRKIRDVRKTRGVRKTGDVRKIRDVRARLAIGARPHHVPPDSIAIRTPIQEEWIACRTKQH
jgi:hypothetical protein